VFVTSDTGELVLELHGPLNPDTGKFNPMHERSQLVTGVGAHVLGFVPPTPGFYIALVHEASEEPVPFTLQYSAAEKGEHVRFDIGSDRLIGARIKARTRQRRWQLGKTCGRWETLCSRSGCPRADARLRRPGLRR
jgi:hypothetical protein